MQSTTAAAMKMMLLVGAVMTVAITSFLLPPSSAGADSTKDVVVINGAANPVPVAGTVAATQSGVWTVGIAGAPSVTVADDREPFEAPLYLQANDGEFDDYALIEVPADRRLVVEFISVSISLPLGQTPWVRTDDTTQSLIGLDVPLEPQGSTSTSSGVNNRFAAAVQVLEFAGPGETYRVGLVRTSASGPQEAPGVATMRGYISGYLLPA